MVEKCPEIVLKFSKKLVLKFYFVLLGSLKLLNVYLLIVVYPYVADTRPLHLAAKNNHLSCIRELVQNGADYNAVDSHGRTSMYVAAEMGHEDAVLEHLNNAYGKTILSLPTKYSGTSSAQLIKMTSVRFCSRTVVFSLVLALEN